MTDFNPLPAAISHKKLNALLSKAKLETLTANDPFNDYSQEKKDFEKLLLNWSSLSEELLRALNTSQEHLKEGRGSKAIIALGALGAHLNMALQAQKASESNE